MRSMKVGRRVIDVTPPLTKLLSFTSSLCAGRRGDLGVADGVIQGQDRRRDEKNGGKMKITAKKVARFRKKQ